MKSKIFLLFFSLPVIILPQVIKVLKSDLNSIDISYQPIIDLQGKNPVSIRNIYLQGTVYEKNNFEDLPSNLINIGVPNINGNTIEILDSKFESFDIEPEVNAIGKLSAENFNSIIVNFDEIGIFRNLFVAGVRVSPIKINSEKNKLNVYSKIVFRIKYSSQRFNREKINEDIIKKAIINFDVASNWGISQNNVQKVTAFSKLANGTWYRFEAPKEGIYKIYRNQLTQLGIDPNMVDPRTIKIFNNGVDILDESMSSSYNVGLEEIAIKIVGEEDGKFDESDYILFYGFGNNVFEYDSKTSQIIRKKNIYSRKNYFFISSGGEVGKRIQSQPSINSNNRYLQTTSKAYYFLDEDKVNIGKSGRDYWGDELNNSVRTKTYLSNLQSINSNKIKYKFRFVNASSPNILLTISESGTTLINQTLFGYGNAGYTWGKDFNLTATYNGSILNNLSQLKLSINPSSTEGKLLIDYYEIEYLRDLKSVDNTITFFSKDTTANIEYYLSNFSSSDINVFNITDFANVKTIEPSFLSGGDYHFITSEIQNNLSKYYACTNSAFKSISGIEKISNSNIQGFINGAEYVIITSKKFSTEANRLKNYRQNDSPNPKTSEVFFVEDIYNEFSCGKLDPSAIRNFLRYAYVNWTTKPLYALFLGDGTYDFLDVEGFGTNYIPTYQTRNSVLELESFPSDDFYSRISGNDSVADIAIGRIPILSGDDANNYIDKIIKYENDNDGSLWRTRVTLVADDGLTSRGNDGNIHTKQAEILAKKKIPDYMDENKIYLSAYPTVISGFGRRKPQVNVAIIDAVNNGTLLLNYTGHGNPDVWAHENVFERASTIPQFKNEKLFFLTAATCDFGKYDDPNIISGTEEMLLLRNYGMIGGFSASRLVFSDQNAAINELYYTNLFSDFGNTTFGDAFLLTKQKRTGDNDEKFHLFCDPSIKIKTPTFSAVIDKINDVKIIDNIQIKALSLVKITGYVADENNQPLSSYNGEGILSVFDSEKSKLLEDINYLIKEQGGVLFRGRVTVKDGNFQVEFRVPKDISYENKNGKITAYIFNDNADAIGFTNKIIVGGTDSTFVNDNKGPEINIYFDNLENEQGYLVNPNFSLIVKLSDETGLNTSGMGVGHKLEGVLDKNENVPIDFSNFFIGDLDSGGKSGIIHYNFTGMEIGRHSLKIKAWDIFNNPTITEIDFEVVNSNSIVLKDIYNFPNPFSSGTTFTFQHNFSEPLDIRVKVYTVAGRLIRDLEENNVTDRFVKIFWDGKDNDGNQLANGTYFYKLILRNQNQNILESFIGKLAVLK